MRSAALLLIHAHRRAGGRMHRLSYFHDSFTGLQTLQWGISLQRIYIYTVKPALNGPFIKRKSVLNGNIFRSLDFGAEKDVK